MSITRARFAARTVAAVTVAAALLTGGMGAAGAADRPPVGPGAVAEAPEVTVPVQLSPEEIYVYVTYNLLFYRAPEEDGLAYWANALRTGTPRRAVADFITSSDEFRGGLIDDTYGYYLDREADTDGRAYWLGQMRKGLTIQQMQASFIASPEYIANAGSTANWVTSLYDDVLGRAASDSEVAFWANAYDTKKLSGQQIALGFLLSTELLSWQIEGEYNWFLDREADAAGVAYWVGLIQKGTRYENVIGSIIASDEFWNLTQTL